MSISSKEQDPDSNLSRTLVLPRLITTFRVLFEKSIGRFDEVPRTDSPSFPNGSPRTSVVPKDGPPENLIVTSTLGAGIAEQRQVVCLSSELQ